MKKAKKIASLVVASALLTSSFAAITSVNAAEVDSTQTASADSTLRDKVGDGVMLHAFNWSYNTIKENLPAIAAAGYTTVQTSPVQQPKDYSTSGDVTGQWWKLYQPISFHIAEESSSAQRMILNHFVMRLTNTASKSSAISFQTILQMPMKLGRRL